MGRPNRLTPASVRAHRAPGRYADGECLFLNIAPGGSKSWICRVTKNGRQRDIGLGSVSLLTLAQAREAARKVRLEVKAGLDPVAQRRRSKGIPSFREAAVSFIAENEKSWTNAKHGVQWLRTLEAYAFPKLGDLGVDAITPAEVRNVLLEIWLEVPETSRRVRQRIGAVLDWAHVAGYRPDRVLLPSAGKGLPRQPKGVRHQPALPYAQLPAFMLKLRERENLSRLALEFLILTACRSGEVRGAMWSEFEFETGLWTIPGSRMKGQRRMANPQPHIVPLSPAAIAVLKRAEAYRTVGGELVFPGLKLRQPLSDMALTKLLRDLGAKDENGANAVAHGFRATFRTWVSDETTYQRELAEKALAHKLPSAMEASYARGDMIEKRRRLMGAWADFANGSNAKVVKIAGANGA